MNIDELRAKRVREAIGATRELRHTTHAARKHAAAAIRLQRPAAGRLHRKLEQLEATFKEYDAERPSYAIDDYVSDLLSALASEVERLEAVEKQLLKLQAKLTKQAPKTQAKVDSRKAKREKRAEELARQAKLKAVAAKQRDAIKRMRARAKASGDPELVNHIEKQIVQAREMPRLTPNIIARLTERGLDEYAADFRTWFDGYERAEELKG